MMVTLDGYDNQLDFLIEKIHVWNDSEHRDRVIKTLPHNKKVKLLKNDGFYSLIKCGLFKKGWVCNWFIREIKNGVRFR